MLVGTLEKMALGGIRDHLGGGFHRYSVDRYWRIPHFEKMLYDNGQLASVYAQAYRADRAASDFRRVTVELCDFVLRELTRRRRRRSMRRSTPIPKAKRASSIAGRRPRSKRRSSAEEFALFAKVYGLDGEPNFEEKFYAPQLSKPLAEIAAEMKLTEAALEAQLAPIRQKLLEVRASRARAADRHQNPHGRQRPDDRRPGRRRPHSQGAAIRRRRRKGRRLRAHEAPHAGRPAAADLCRRRGQAQRLSERLRVPGRRADRAAPGHGQRQRWLDEAAAITAKQIELFSRRAGGGFFFTSSDHEALLARGKELADNAQPAGNSVAANNLISLAALQNKPEYLPLACKTIAATVVVDAKLARRRAVDDDGDSRPGRRQAASSRRKIDSAWPAMSLRTFHLAAEHDGLTLAAALKRLLPDQSWSQVRKLIAGRRVQVNGNLCLDEERKVKAGDVVKLWIIRWRQPATADDVQARPCR